MKEQLGAGFQWVAKNVKLMGVYSAIVSSFGLAAYTKVTLDTANDMTHILSTNCDDFKTSHFVTGVLVEGKSCRNRTIQTKSIDMLQQLHQLTKIDLEKLFAAGEYSIDKKEALELKKKEDSIFRYLAQQRQVLYIQGSADKAGDSTFIKSLSTEKCANQDDFNRIQLHASAGDNYEKQLSSRKIPSPFKNPDLPQLRARSFQCWLKSEYPNISTEIIEGGVQSTVGSQYRRVRIFIDNKPITNQLTSISNHPPSSD
jgi:hypothetical protein